MMFWINIKFKSKRSLKYTKQVKAKVHGKRRATPLLIDWTLTIKNTHLICNHFSLHLYLYLLTHLARLTPCVYSSINAKFLSTLPSCRCCCFFHNQLTILQFDFLDAQSVANYLLTVFSTQTKEQLKTAAITIYHHHKCYAHLFFCIQ